MTAQLKADLEKIKGQTAKLVFDSFDETTARALGALILDSTAGKAVIVDIRRGNDLLFFGSNPGTSPANADWARRKRNLVNTLQVPSYAIGCEIKLGTDIIALMALDPRDHTPHGGCVPIVVRGAGMIGTVTVSGLPQRDDHRVATDCMAQIIGVELGEDAF